MTAPPDDGAWPTRLLLALLTLLLVRTATLPILPLIDTTESRYALVAVDMANRGDWITPYIRIHDQIVPFEGKPPLHFWVGAATVELFGRHETSARLPSLLAFVVTLLLLLRLGARVVGREAARAGAILFAISPMTFSLAGTVVVDGTLTACTTAAILLGLTHDPTAPVRRRVARGAVLGAVLGLGFLAKGPITLAIVGGAGIAVCLVRRSLDPLRGHAWVTGGATLLLVAGPWFAISEMRHPGFLEYFFLQENLLRFTRSEIGDPFGNVHVYFRGVSLAWWALGAIPLLLMIPFAARSSRRSGTPGAWRASPFPEVIAASLAIALLLSPSRNILATYLLPTAPFTALAAGAAWVQGGLTLRRLGTVGMLVAALFAALALAAEPRTSANRSCRDVIALARRTAIEHGRTEIVFPRKTPWSAYYYGAGWVPPRSEDVGLLRILETIEGHPDAVFVMKHRALRKLPQEVRVWFEVVEDTGRWLIVVPDGPSADSPR